MFRDRGIEVFTVLAGRFLLKLPEHPGKIVHVLKSAGRGDFLNREPCGVQEHQGMADAHKMDILGDCISRLLPKQAGEVRSAYGTAVCQSVQA